MEDNYIQIRQISGSEQLLKEWMNGLNLDADIIYALIYVPMDCPRCEVAIPNFREILRKVDPEQKMILITAYPDSIAAKAYNQRKNYQADAYLYDTTEQYSKIFNTNMSGGLMGLHILKIDKKRGELLTGGEYTVLNELFIKQLIAYKGKLEKSSFPITNVDNDSSYTEIPKEFQLLRISKKYQLDRTVTVSSIYDVPRFFNDRLFFSDVLQNGVMLYKQDKDSLKLVTLLRVDSTEKNRFVNVPQDVYDDFDRHKMFYYIALGTNLLDDQHIGISYSIPKVVQDGAENAYGFYNAPVILSRNIHTLEPDSMLALDFELDTDTTFFNTHYSFTSFKNSIVVGCEKLTWPMEYEREDYESIPEKNPFRPAFYEFQTPFIATFDKTNGHLIQRYGNLDKVHAESRTGYYFTNPISATFGNEFLFTDGYSGKLYITNETSKEALC